MAQRKPYNPNTKYGRKKIREEYAQRRAEMTPEERSGNDALATIVLIIIIIFIGGCAFLIGGKDAVLKTLSH